MFHILPESQLAEWTSLGNRKVGIINKGLQLWNRELSCFSFKSALWNWVVNLADHSDQRSTRVISLIDDIYPRYYHWDLTTNSSRQLDEYINRPIGRQRHTYLWPMMPKSTDIFVNAHTHTHLYIGLRMLESMDIRIVFSEMSETADTLVQLFVKWSTFRCTYWIAEIHK